MVSLDTARRGFTLLELVLVLIITAILSIAGFSFSSTYSRFHAHTVSDEIYSLLNTVVSLARMHRQPIIVSCDFEQHIISAKFQNDSKTITTLEAVSFSPTLKLICPKQVHFNPDGRVWVVGEDAQEVQYRVDGKFIFVDRQTGYVYE